MVAPPTRFQGPSSRMCAIVALPSRAGGHNPARAGKLPLRSRFRGQLSRPGGNVAPRTRPRLRPGRRAATPTAKPHPRAEPRPAPPSSWLPPERRRQSDARPGQESNAALTPPEKSRNWNRRAPSWLALGRGLHREVIAVVRVEARGWRPCAVGCGRPGLSLSSPSAGDSSRSRPALAPGGWPGAAQCLVAMPDRWEGCASRWHCPWRCSGGCWWASVAGRQWG